ncbi:MAG: hypothetical protein ACOC97_00355 [Myxococcota bacterium]
MRHPGHKAYPPLTWWIPLVLLAVSACGGAGPPPREATDASLRIISEADAVGIISDTIRATGAELESGWEVDIAAEEPLQVDIRLEGTNYGVEWVSSQDRLDYGTAIPDPDPDGQLRILPGAGEDEEAQILVLDFRTYRYDPDPERVRGGAPGAREVESRLRRDVRDFLEYVRGQGAI